MLAEVFRKLNTILVTGLLLTASILGCSQVEKKQISYSSWPMTWVGAISGVMARN